ncbi:MAG: hypothetical protein R3A44_40155 [Caldilineaceae bacterium]
MLRNTIAVMAGFVVWASLFISSKSLLTAGITNTLNGAFPKPGMLVFIIVLSVIFSVIAGLITARVANVSPTIPTLILGLTLLTAAFVKQIQFWDMLPVWYHLSFLLLLMPGVFMGARLQTA